MGFFFFLETNYACADYDASFDYVTIAIIINNIIIIIIVILIFLP